MQPSFIPPFSMLAALDWLTSTLLGTVGTSVAAIAVAGIGFSMLQGRTPVRKGVVVIIGCFILFASRMIAAGLLGMTSATSSLEIVAPVVPPPAYIAPIPPPVAYDPYAGASVPVRPTDSAAGIVPQ